jgi:glucosamine-6-phosphate deaminase
MRVQRFDDRQAMSEAAARAAAASLREAVSRRGRARVVAATAASQLAFLDSLVGSPGVPWSQIELFHLDEYVGLPISHPASFRRILTERLVEKTGIRNCHWLDCEHDPPGVCERVGAALASAPVDIAFLGIGENSHLAFNDPPADFETTDPYIVVRLDDACRRQQVGEGWFARLEDVPETAVSMSIRQILRAEELLVIVPDARKAAAVKASLEGDISPMVPASILRTHGNATLFIDEPSASKLSAAARAHYRI